ncbi:N-acetylmuramic acid 6-phosphate etherase [Gaoshiqia sp. Z1-71]|uniref:N-acetylmuramic acid 6-phosphate etherase n=1 Tax=Gaoshiqia hydrogeniformans TaxID=3290090 RepID=UPI003BF82B35
MMKKITELPSPHRHLEKKSVGELIRLINQEDQTVAMAIAKVLPQLERLISAIEEKLKSGGRMFYLGCGTGGRLAVLDIIELYNTYGIERGFMNVILAGGVDRLVEAIEEREDNTEEGWNELLKEDISANDIVIGISASGTTPYVLATLKKCKDHGIATGSIVNNPQSPISEYADYPIEMVTGPEFVTGSTRMKAGTSQKMVFDMISTATLIRLGRVEDNKMINVRLINEKVVDRSVRMIMELTGIGEYEKARDILLKCGNVKRSVEYYKSQVNNSRQEVCDDCDS